MIQCYEPQVKIMVKIRVQCTWVQKRHYCREVRYEKIFMRMAVMSILIGAVKIYLFFV